MNITNETEWVEYLGCGVPIYLEGEMQQSYCPLSTGGRGEGERERSSSDGPSEFLEKGSKVKRVR
jgi:hypothetical protein